MDDDVVYQWLLVGMFVLSVSMLVVFEQARTKTVLPAITMVLFVIVVLHALSYSISFPVGGDKP